MSQRTCGLCDRAMLPTDTMVSCGRGDGERFVHVTCYHVAKKFRLNPDNGRTLTCGICGETMFGVCTHIADAREALAGPEVHDFAAAVVKEAAFQRAKWGSDHDAGKAPTDWLWLLGWLAGKAVHAALAGDRDKALHHVITTAAACANWHAAIEGTDTRMRPGIAPPGGGAHGG